MTPAALVAVSLLLFVGGFGVGELARIVDNWRRKGQQAHAATRLRRLVDADAVWIDGSTRPLRVVGYQMDETGLTVHLTDGSIRYRLTASDDRLVLKREGARYASAVTVGKIRAG